MAVATAPLSGSGIIFSVEKILDCTRLFVTLVFLYPVAILY